MSKENENVESIDSLIEGSSGDSTVEVIAVSSLNGAFQARREWVDEQITDLKLDESDPDFMFYAGYRKAILWLEQSIDVLKVSVEAKAMPREQ